MILSLIHARLDIMLVLDETFKNINYYILTKEEI